MSDLLTIQKILSEPKYQRTNEQVSQLISMLKPIKVFKSLLKSSSVSGLSELCQLLQFESHKASSYVFKYGDVGTHYYIILEGRVSMQIPTGVGKHFTEVMIYERHSGFGEIALEAYKTRGGSAYCITDCHFLTIDKKDYLRHMQGFLSENKRKIVNFLENLPFFNQMSRILLSKLTYNIQEVIFRKGQFVVKEGDEPEKIFILRTGECQLSKRLQRELSPTRVLKSIPKYCNFTVKTLMEGALIGEEAALNNLPYNFSCIVSSDSAVFFQISLKEFFARVNSDDLIKYLHKQSEQKEKNIADWENMRNELGKAFTSTEKDNEEVKENVTRIFKKCSLRNCLSEKKISFRSESCKKIEKYAKDIAKPNHLPILSRASSNSRTPRGISIMPLNTFPILSTLHSPKPPSPKNP